MIKILIVDDHAVVRKGVREILESEADLKVLGEADTGRKAIDLAKKEKWDLGVLTALAKSTCDISDILTAVSVNLEKPAVARLH